MLHRFPWACYSLGMKNDEEPRGLQSASRLLPATPLWRRVPTRMPDGRPYHDFMMLIPRLRQAPRSRQQEVIDALERVFASYGKAVAFVDLNLKLNLLWVSVRPAPGLCLEMAQVIQHAVPEALLIASQADALERFRATRKRLSREQAAE